MRRFLNLKFLLALVLGVGVVGILAVLSNDDDAENTYGEPDNDTAEGDVSSFVD